MIQLIREHIKTVFNNRNSMAAEIERLLGVGIEDLDLLKEYRDANLTLEKLLDEETTLLTLAIQYAESFDENPQN